MFSSVPKIFVLCSQQLRQAPRPIRDPRSHRRGPTLQARVLPAEIVEREVQGQRSFQVTPFFAERIRESREPGQPFAPLAKRSVLPFDM